MPSVARMIGRLPVCGTTGKEERTFAERRASVEAR
jgi:hypothetical protein